jgi:rhodanese-related sulfurtransferase
MKTPLNKPVVIQASLVLFCATIAGTEFNLLRPQPLLGVPASMLQAGNIIKSPSLKEIQECFWGGNGEFVDARPSPQFISGHLAGAINIPAQASGGRTAKVFQSLSPEARIIVYGADISDSDVFSVSDFLRSQGFKPHQISIFKPGWRALHGLPQARGAE